MEKNPTIEELNNSGKFEKIAEISRSKIKEFVFDQIRQERLLITVYMIYQIVMVLLGTFFVTRAVALIFRGFPEPFYWTVGSVVLSFTVLVIIHEALHGMALKITGAKKISYGANLRSFMFFAEADRHVLNRRQFRIVALTPLVVIQFLSIYGLIVLFREDSVYLVIMIMCLHSLFCAGDIGLLSFFYGDQGEFYVYDDKSENKSYYFRKKE